MGGQSLKRPVEETLEHKGKLESRSSNSGSDCVAVAMQLRATEASEFAVSLVHYPTWSITTRETLDSEMRR